MIVLDHPAHASAIAKAAGVTSGVIYSVARECAAGKLMGGVIYSEYTGASVHVHVAGFRPNWLSSDFLWTMFDYGFNHLGCYKIIGLVSSGNPHALAFDLKVGFAVESRVEGYYRDGDLVILSMKKNFCRWLGHVPKSLQVRKHNGQAVRTAAA